MSPHRVRSATARSIGGLLLALAISTTLAACDGPQQESPPQLDPNGTPPPSETPAPAPSESPTAAPRGDSLGADDIENIRDAVSSGNTAALEGYFADPTRVAIAASDADSGQSPVDAVLSLDYVQPGVGDWDFALPATTIAQYQASEYYDEFFPPDAIVGRSDTGAVVAFSPSGGTIATVFMAIDESLLFD